MQWQYKRVGIDILDAGGAKFEEMLNALGSQGWELASTLQHARHGYSHEVHLVFKRPLASSSAVAAE